MAEESVDEPTPARGAGVRRPPGPQTVRGQRRRALILKVAAQLFAQHGYDGVSIDDIGAAAGITGPGLYRYFGGKDAVLAAIYEHLYARNREGFDSVLTSELSGPGLLVRLVELQIQLAVEEPEKVRIASNEERHLVPDVARRLQEERRRWLRSWVELVRDARPDLALDEVEATVHGALALINSVSLRRRAEPPSPQVLAHLRAMAIGVVLGEAGAATAPGVTKGNSPPGG